MAGDDDFRVRPGKGKSRGSGSTRPQSLAAQVKRAAARAGFSRRCPRRSNGTGRLGRGRVAALGARRSATSRRVVIKARIVRHHGARFRAAPLARHIAYLERDGVTRDGRDASLFDAGSERADGDAFAARCGDDRHHFRFIVSPEDATELSDLRAFTRELMDDAARDLGTRLDWVAVDHWNTDNPHIHVLVRGLAEDGADLVIDRDYISRGLRDRAEARATLELGPRSQQQIDRSLAREVAAERWTSLDRSIAARADEQGLVDLRPSAGMQPGKCDLLLTGRAQTLERLGIAQAAGPARWVLRAGMESTLRELGERGDIIKTMHRAMRDAGHAIHDNGLAIHPPGDSERIVGRLVARGLQDELAGSAYAVIDGIDGRHHHLRFADLEQTGDASPGAIVELRHWRDGRGTLRSALAVRSDLALDQQIRARGATWLDRQLLGSGSDASSQGFGGEVRTALAAREDHLVGEGLASRRGSRVMLAPNLIETLRTAELRDAAARIATRTGLTPHEAVPGMPVAGTYRERVTLASGRFAMIDDGLGFQLVPWRPALDRQLGMTVTGTLTPGGVDWTLGRGRSLGF
jgi:type IV secretory pathway VirD2 relaxase